MLHHKLLQQKTALFCSQLQQVCCRPATPRRTQVMQRRKTPKPSHLLLADLHGLLLHLWLLKSRSSFCMAWLHPDCMCCMVHLGSCCVCNLLCVCVWLSPCRDILFVLLNCAVTSVNALIFAMRRLAFVLFYSKLFTKLSVVTILQTLEHCNQTCYGSR